MKTIFLKTLIIFLGIILSLFIAEIFLRFFWNVIYLNQKYKRDDLKWLSENVILNNFGYRGDDFSIIKPRNTFRIYFLGDSYTFGWYINDVNATYPKIIEDKLRKEYGKEKIEVINAAKPGFSLNDSLNRFQNEGVLFGSDLIFIGINVYDLLDKEFPPKKIFPPLSNLRIYELTLGNIEKRKSITSTDNYLKEILRDNSEQLKRVDSIISQLNSNVSKTGGRLVVIIFPNYDPSNPNEGYQYYAFHQLMKKNADKNNVSIIDPFTSFQKVIDKKELVLNPTDSHPSILANQKIADQIIKDINFEDLVNNNKLVTQNLKTISGPIKNNFLDFHAIISFSDQDNWVYFNRENKLGVQNHPLPSIENRKSKYFVDYLKTVKSSTHEGWVGAKIEYNYPTKLKEIVLPRVIYGYPIVGISQITAFYRERGNLNSQDLTLGELDISKDEKQIYIKILNPKDFDYYRLNLDIQVKQLDIENSQIVSASQTEILSKKILDNNEQIIFPKPSLLTSLPKFISEGISTNYIWYDGKMVTADIPQKDGILEVNITSLKHDNMSIELPVNVELEEGSFKPPEINYL